MDYWIAAFKEIVALTALGGAFGGMIDFLMYKSEKAKLKALLEDWWLRFTDVKWSNFGRAEAELAVQILDRWAGPRLWSWKRWRLSTIVTVLAFVFPFIWVLGRNSDILQRFDVIRIARESAMVLPSIVAFALSLSVTRFISVRAAQLCKSRGASVTVFTALLSLHLLLLFYWSAFVISLNATAMRQLVRAGAFFVDGMPFDFDFERELRAVYGVVALEVPQGGKLLPQTWRILFAGYANSVETVLYSFTTSMDVIANGLRIVFALVFLSSFVFRPLIQEPLSRVWYAVINSSKGTFTMLFGAIGALIAAGQVLAK